MLVSWNDQYALGIAAIDTGQGLVIETINELNDATTQQAGMAVAARMLPVLRRHLAAQFAAEEALMAGQPADQRTAHRQEHRQMTEVLDFLWQQQADGEDVSGPLLLNLVCFLTVHLRHTDAESYPHPRLHSVAA